MGFVFNKSDNEESNINELDIASKYQSHFQVVFVDLYFEFNLSHNITLDLYQRLKYDVNITLAQLNELNVNIQSIFLSRIDFCLYFDYYIK